MIRKSAFLLSTTLMLNGCAWIDAIGEKIVSLTNPVLMSGIVIGVDLPDDENINELLEASGVPLGTTITVIVANAAGADGVEDAVVKTGKVSIVEGGRTIFNLENEKSSGLWIVGPEEGLEWTPGSTWTFNADIPDRPLPGKVKIQLGESAGANLPLTTELGDKITLDLKGGNFEYAIAAIFDLEGNLIYDSRPTEVDEMIELITRVDPVEKLVIPKKAFPEEGLYLIGIAGIRETHDEDLTDLNSALSKFFYGRMKLAPIAVGSPVVANAFLLGTSEAPPELSTAIEEAGYGSGTSMTINVIDVTKFGDPLLDATVNLEGFAALDTEGTGTYTIELEDGPIYQAGDEWTIRVDHPDLDNSSILRQVMPASPDVDIPAQHPQNQDMVIDVGPDFASSVVVVLGESGEILFSNESESDDDILALLEDDEAVATPVTIPGTAFATIGGVRAIGVAGLSKANVDDFDDVVVDFSNMISGQLTFYPVVIAP